MAAVVPTRRTEPSVSPVAAGAPVSARTWRETAQLLAWVEARGRQLIPAHAPNIEINDNLSHTIPYGFTPQKHAIDRVWSVRLWQDHATGGTTPAQVKITLPTGATFTVWPSINPAYDIDTVLLFERLPSAVSTRSNVTLTVQRVAGAEKFRVSEVACWELPRSVLTTGLPDGGVEQDGLRPGLPVYDVDYHSLGGIARGWAAASTHRVLWSQSFPELGVASTSLTDLFVLPAPVLPRKTTRSATTYTATWDVRARVSDGLTSGTVQITTGRSGNTATIAVPLGSTSHAWRGTSTIVLDCEVPDAYDGLPGSSVFETVQIAVKAAGGGTVYVESVLVEE